jgi:hypothetical protein
MDEGSHEPKFLIFVILFIFILETCNLKFYQIYFLPTFQVDAKVKTLSTLSCFQSSKIWKQNLCLIQTLHYPKDNWNEII